MDVFGTVTGIKGVSDRTPQNQDRTGGINTKGLYLTQIETGSFYSTGSRDE